MSSARADEAANRVEQAPGKLLPVLYSCAGLVDCTTIEEALAARG